MIAALGQGLQLALYELAAQGGYVVNEHVAVQMVELMLHNAGQISLYPFIVLLKLLVHPLYVNAGGPCHFLVNGR